MKYLGLLGTFLAGTAVAQTEAVAPAESLVHVEQEVLLSQIALIFTNAVDLLNTVFSTRLVGLQLGCIVVAVLASWMFAAPIKRHLLLRADAIDPTHVGKKTVSILYRWIARVTTSIIALLVLGVMQWGFFKLNVFQKSDALYFMHLADFIFLAYAGVKSFVYLLRGALGSDHVSAGLERSIISVFWFAVVLQVFGLLPGIIEFFKSIDLPILGEGMTVWKVLVAIFWSIISLMVASWLVRIYSEWINEQDSLHPNIRMVFDRVGRIVLMAVAILLVLDAVGFNLAVLSVFGGALGVGLGFGLQKIASNYISGFIILLDRSIKLGDLVRVAGFQGTVKEINTRYTVVRNTSGVECIVPNENFVTSVVENMSYSESQVRGVTSVSVAYNADVDLAIKILLEIADEHPRIDHSRSNYAMVTNFGADGVDLELGYWIIDPRNGIGGIKSDISREILRRYEAAGIEIPFAQREIRLLGEPTIRMVREK